jgi:hypothetical protein
MRSNPLDAARKFAAALDAEDYETAGALLASNCDYHSPSGLIVGPAAIVASYRGIGESARRKLDAIEYTSAVEMGGPDVAIIEFTDSLQYGKRRHVYRCRQAISVNDRGLIVEITHEELPQERARLEDFLNGVV